MQMRKTAAARVMVGAKGSIIEPPPDLENVGLRESAAQRSVMQCNAVCNAAANHSRTHVCTGVTVLLSPQDSSCTVSAKQKNPKNKNKTSRYQARGARGWKGKKNGSGEAHKAGRQ